MNKHVYPVILSGGSGTRMWPLSRKLHPKQMLDLMDCGETLIQSTAKRLENLQDPIVICSEAHRFMVAQQMQELNITPHSILLEPIARNTAPAIVVAALRALEDDSDALIAVFPADHHIEDSQRFEQALEKAIAKAEQNKLMTFGIVPNRPETGYGYIKVTDGTSLDVDKFVEKPALEVAKQYLKSGEYYWNSGMFVFNAKQLLNEIKIHSPGMVESCEQALEQAKKDLDFIRLSEAHFAACESISIDYALMEKTRNAALVPLDAGWSDIGSWDSLWGVMPKDDDGNVLIGDILTDGTNNSYVHATQKLTTLLGVKDLVVVDTDDALMIANKDIVQNVKLFPKYLEQNSRSEYLHHRQVHRPWGSYDSIENGERFQVKNLTVSPGASLSLQLHHHRAEHWIVVEGTAKVQIGDKEKVLSENESVYIPIGEKHRLSNPGKIPLKIIEVQSGSYLGEDDIVRFEDDYRREE